MADYLYYTEAELTVLKVLKTEDSHSTIWSNISTWADAHVNDSPPAEPTGTWRDWMNTADAIRIFIETMTFMYHMTDDTDYADAAVAWMLSVAGWSTWDGAGSNKWQVRSWMGIGFACGYNGLYSYLSSADRQTIRENMVEQIGIVYDWYSPFNYFLCGYPNHESLVGSMIGLGSLALGDDYAGSDAWMTFALTVVDHVFSLAGQDGDWIEGPSYTVYAMEALTQFIDALRRSGGTDYFTTQSNFLSNAAYYLIYMTVDDDHSIGQTSLMMEDFSGNMSYFKDSDLPLNYVYKLAKEYGDGYAQSFANTYSKQTFMQNYIWKDPDLVEQTISNLPLNRYFSDIGYVMWKAGWGNDDWVFLFKSGRSLGHSHSDQNSFYFQAGARPFSSGPGYVVSWAEYDMTQYANCITVDGLGQAQEPGDLGTAPEGTVGVVEEVTIDNYYKYVRGDGSAPYLGEDNGHYLLDSGYLTKWLRHVVSVEDYFVMYDDVATDVASQFDWFFHGRNIYNETSDAVIDGDLVTFTRGSYRMEIKVVEPTSFNYNIIYDSGPYNRDWEYIKVRPQTNVASAQFLNVLCPDDSLSTASKTVDRVNVGNCVGVIVTYSDKKDLILFSRDGAAVEEEIELGGYYKAADGGSYTFDTTTINVVFSTYAVIRLEEAVERQSPDILIVQTNLTGSVSDIQDDPDSPDANWLTYSSNNVDTVCRVSFPTPTGNPTQGADLQEFKVWVRKQPGTGTPQIQINLYEDGVDKGVILALTDVTSSSGELFSATWNANLLGTADGSLVECRIFGDAVGGAPAGRCTVEIGAVEWNVTYDVGGVTYYGIATLSGVGTLAGIGALILNGLATLAGTGALATIGRKIVTGATTLAGVGLLSAIGGVYKLGVTTLSGLGTLAANAVATFTASSTLTGAGVLSAIGRGIFAGSATLSGAGTLSAIGRKILAGVVTLTGAGTLSAVGRRVVTGITTLAGSGSLSAIGRQIVVSIVTLSGTGILVAKSIRILISKATLSGEGALSTIGRLVSSLAISEQGASPSGPAGRAVFKL